MIKIKALNFSVAEILPSLLDKTKTQTIRPAWVGITDDNKIFGYKAKLKVPIYSLEEKPPRFKVGDKVKLFWKQRSKYKWFCSKCGVGRDIDDLGEDDSELIFIGKHACYPNYKNVAFNKLLGTAEITEVFKIEMEKLSDKRILKLSHHQALVPYHISQYEEESTIRSEYSQSGWNKDLAKRDGFSSAEQMFKTIDKMYDLSSPKSFYVYRWRWIK